MKKQRVCPHCDSFEVIRLPKSEVAPHPGYRCDDCDLIMRPNGSGIMYVVGMILSIGVIALAIFAIRDPEAGGIRIGLPIAGIVVFFYSLRMMLRPTPKLVHEETEPTSEMD
jgi:hypothetical protein